ncbi:MAG: hypothetical protein EP320_06640 [Rhodobacteraceae bacterium]|nr:MAG: hypothetical protein EP320_06640 [Paracoccaceae bacterium]
MKRRSFVVGGLVALVAGTGQAVAETATEAVVRQLRAYGYREIEVERSFLGRIRITAERKDIEREIVLDPRTGEILRDLSRKGRAPILGNNRLRSEGGGSSPGTASDSGDSDDRSESDSESDSGGSEGSDDGGSDSDSDSGSDSGSDDGGGDDGGGDDDD